MLQHGIDLHKRTLVIATVDEVGTLIKRTKLPARRPDLLRDFDSLAGPHRAVVEATGSWYGVADTLEARGIELKLAHARRLKAVASAKVKTDAVDALTLAQLLRVDLIPEAHMIAPELREYRDLLRTRLRLVQKRTSAKNSGQSHAGEVQRPGDGRASAVRVPAGGPLRGPDRAALDADPAARATAPAEPESGRGSAAPALDPHRRSKEGNRYLKATFSHSALRAIQYYPEIRAFYQAKLRRKNRFVARALVAKELARIAYYVLHDQVDFTGTFKGVPLTHLKQPQWPRRASPDA